MVLTGQGILRCDFSSTYLAIMTLPDSHIYRELTIDCHVSLWLLRIDRAVTQIPKPEL